MIQNLEHRTLLTATVLLTGSHLQVLADADEDIVVREDPVNSQRVQVQINGSTSTAVGVVSTTSLTLITIEAGDEDNTVDVSTIDSLVFTSLSRVDIFTGNGDDTILTPIDIPVIAEGGDGEDTITAQGAADTLRGGDGDDVINAGDGADDVDAGDGEDLVNGEGGDDTIQGDDGDDTLSGGSGNDSIVAHDGNDNVSGDAGTDTLFGDLGDDVIDGGDNDDLIFAGANNDLVDGGLGNDTLFGNGGQDTIAGGDGDDSINAGTSIDSVDGGSGNDNINGGLGNDTLAGGAANDSIYGGSGADTLFGDDAGSGAAVFGNDLILGQAGNDTILGGPGSDTMDGGNGNDLVQSGDVPPPTDPFITIDDASALEGDDPAATVFGGPVNAPTTGTSHDFVVAADFDNDGDLDVASENSVSFNDGSGMFSNPLAITTGATGFMDTADFDGDGNIDIVAPTGSGDINIILNQGGGVFAPPVRYSFSGSIFGAEAVHVGDFDQDGDVDVAAAIGFAVTEVFVLYNDGNADFSNTIGFSTISGGGISDIEAGDIDNDGDLDLMVSKDFFQSSVDVLRNSGNGQFTAIAAVPMGTGPGTVEAGDLDGDGDLDIAIAGTQGLTPVISTSINSGGTFSAGTITTGVGTNVFNKDVQIADFDLDGDADVLTVESDKDLQLYVNDGTGAFSTTFQFTDASGQTSIINDGIVADFNGDTAPDLAVGRGGGVSTIAVWLNQGIFSTEVVLPVRLSAPSMNTVTVDFATADGLATGGQDYIPASGTVVFAPGDVLQTITVQVRGDAIPEGDEDFRVNLSNPVNGILADAQASVVSLEDDGGASGPSLRISDVTVAEGDTGLTTVDFTVTLSEAPASPVTVEFATADVTAIDGIDYQGVSGQLTFDAMSLSQTISVDVLGDTLNEGDETFVLNLFDVVGAPVIDGQGQGLILDDDAAQPLPNPDDTLTGGNGNDTLIGSIGDDLAVGDLGNDSIDGGEGDDTLLGGGGNDIIDGSAGDDSLSGQGGHDTLNGGTGEDILIHRGDGDGKDVLSGGQGANQVQINLTSAADTAMVGQDAQGRLTVTQNTSVATIDTDVATTLVNGGLGDDVITVGDIHSVGLGVLQINGQGGDDQISAATAILGSIRFEIHGGEGDDTLNGSDFGEEITGGLGDDTVFARDGDDEISGGDGTDFIDGGGGNDTADGGAGNDTINGLAGDDLVLGGNDQDLVDGGEGDDTLRGQFGDDTLIGSFGNDSVDGGLGQDNLLGGSGNDVLDGGRNDDVLLGHSGDDTLRGDHGDDFIKAGNGNDEVTGGDGDDIIRGEDGDDGIDAGDGDDHIVGDNGSDTIVAGDGNDTALGGGGNDTILGGDGDDALNGGGASGDLGAVGEGNDLTPLNFETIDEEFMLTAEMLEKLDGM